MDIDGNSSIPSKPQQNHKIIASWMTDTSVTELSDDLFTHLNKKKQLDEESGDVETLPMEYKKPKINIDSKVKINQCMRFNLI
jgi:hypothetical protein